MRRLFTLGLFVLLLAGCSTMKIEDFADREPRFVLEDYFQGKSRAWGIFQDRFGNLKRTFVVDIDGEWDGRVLTLTEDFVYDDGETERRVWRLTKVDQHTYEGTTEDAIGTARGRSFGNAFHFAYDFNLKVGQSRWRVHFDDWMWLQADGIVINRATVSKFGFTLGEATITFRRADVRAANEDRERVNVAAQ